MSLNLESAQPPLPNDANDPAKRVAWFVNNHSVGHDGVAVDPNRPLEASNDALNRILGTDAVVSMTIRAGKEGQFLVVDGRDHARLGKSFLLLNGRSPNQMKVIEPDTPFVVGRDHHTEHFTYPGDVSRTHFSLGYDSKSDTLHIRDEHSRNGTRISGHVFNPGTTASRHKENKIQANYTTMIKRFMSEEPSYENEDQEAPYGYYMGRPIIGRKSRSVKNGVYGTVHSEQLVVDSDSRFVSNIVGIVIHELHVFSQKQSVGQRDILRKIVDEVADILHYDMDATERISSPHYNSRGLINLSDYMKANTGVCRHQAILSALITEQAIQEGILKGSVGVQRNMDMELNGAHAWAVFRDEQSHAIIVDAAHHFVGTREESKNRESWMWDYYVPDPKD